MTCLWHHTDCKNLGDETTCNSCITEDHFYVPKEPPKSLQKKRVNKQDNRQGSKFEYLNHKNNEALISSNMTINSGATAKEKGDEQICGIIETMEELKTQMPDRARGTKVFTIKRQWLDKLHAEALAADKEFWYLKFCFNEDEAVNNGDQIYCITEQDIIMDMITTMKTDRIKAVECDSKIDFYKKKYMELEAKYVAVNAELQAIKATKEYLNIKDTMEKLFSGGEKS